MKDFTNKTVGEIVTQNLKYATVFQSLGIDFCCGGDVVLSDAATKVGIPLEAIVEKLKGNVEEYNMPKALNFDEWSLDLLIDYVVKFHHNYIRTRGPEIYSLVEKVVNVHGETDKHLHTIMDLFKASLFDLNNHLDKEENILFPLIRDLIVASEEGQALPSFHCGSVQNPIYVMMKEHDDEGIRFRKIAELTNGYTAPEYACNSYRLLLDELKQFEENLHIHIHVENNILFPKAVKLESSLD